MSTKNFSQRGQALILLVAAIVGLVAITALAIDAGNAFSDRRHAQNAADTAALAGALTCAQVVPPLPCNSSPLSDQVRAIARNLAAINDFDNNGTTNTVQVYLPPISGPYATHPDKDQYVQVVITSTVNTFFAGIVGVEQITNRVEAIARAKPGEERSLALGHVIAAVDCTGYRTLSASGATNVTLIDAGAFSNSNDPQALFVQWPSNLVTPVDKGLSAVGGIKADGYPSVKTEGLPQFPCPLPDYMLPKYTCNYNYVDFPPAASDANMTWIAGVANLKPGVYCISGSFPKNNLAVTGAVPGPPAPPGGVTFVMLNQGISWQGIVNVHIKAPTSGPTEGLLIYLPYSNSSEILLNGNAGLDITGSVFAPASNIDLRGNFGAQALKSQWIGKTVNMGGGFSATLQYDPSVSYQFFSPPALELAK